MVAGYAMKMIGTGWNYAMIQGILVFWEIELTGRRILIFTGRNGKIFSGHISAICRLALLSLFSLSWQIEDMAYPANSEFGHRFLPGAIMAVMSVPMIDTVPCVGFINPPIIFSMVDLPEPDFPSKETYSPSSKSREMPLSPSRCFFNLFENMVKVSDRNLLNGSHMFSHGCRWHYFFWPWLSFIFRIKKPLKTEKLFFFEEGKCKTKKNGKLRLIHTMNWIGSLFFLVIHFQDFKGGRADIFSVHIDHCPSGQKSMID